MKKQLLAMAMAGAMLLGGCQPTYNENDPNYPGTTQPEQNDTHGDTENFVIVKIYSARKSGYVAVVCDFKRNVAHFFGNIYIHGLYVFFEIFVVYFKEERRNHDFIVNVHARAGYADSVYARHFPCRRFHGG